MKILKIFGTIFISLAPLIVSHAETLDCSEAYDGKPATCKEIECNERFKGFLGTWIGPFESYVKELSSEESTVFRPFNNSITYSKSDCLENVDTGEKFIIGRRTDVYPKFRNLPSKTVSGLLVTGRTSDGSPFLRTIDNENGANEYTLLMKDEEAEYSEWELVVPQSAKQPEMRFKTIDARDKNSARKRMNVEVQMTVGPQESPFWKGIVTQGFHSLYQ